MMCYIECLYYPGVILSPELVSGPPTPQTANTPVSTGTGLNQQTRQVLTQMDNSTAMACSWFVYNFVHGECVKQPCEMCPLNCQGFMVRTGLMCVCKIINLPWSQFVPQHTHTHKCQGPDQSPAQFQIGPDQIKILISAGLDNNFDLGPVLNLSSQIKIFI